MEKIWAPWRVTYVKKILKHNKGCVFCKIVKDKKDKTNFVIKRTKYSYAVLNIYPYNNGHTLVLPRRHVNELSKLRKEERNDLFDLLDEMTDVIKKTIKPHGFNVGMNLGRAAGAGFPGHIHIHVVPRWKGDVNFMPTLAHTKVISQSLKSLHQHLTNAIKN